MPSSRRRAAPSARSRPLIRIRRTRRTRAGGWVRSWSGSTGRGLPPEQHGHGVPLEARRHHVELAVVVEVGGSKLVGAGPRGKGGARRHGKSPAAVAEEYGHVLSGGGDEIGPSVAVAVCHDDHVGFH